MKSLIFIAWQNIKRKRGDTAVFFFLIALATLLLFISTSVFFGLEQVLDNAYERAHTADLLYISNADEGKIAHIMKEQEEVVEYEASKVLNLMEAKYRKEGQKENKQAQFIIGKIDEERKIGKITEKVVNNVDKNGIMLPYYMKAAEGFSEGDIFYFTIGEEEYRFEVIGFVEDPLFATPVNISVYGVYISSAVMESMLEENSVAKASECINHKVRLKEGEDSFEFDKKITPIITQEIPGVSESKGLGVNWASMKGGVGMMSQISMGILLVFSILLMVIVLIVIRFSIRNYIELNLKNVGILQAAGYTSTQLRMSVLIEIGIVAIFAAITGLLLGAAGSDLIGGFEAIMLGMQWRQSFHAGAALLSAVIIVGVVLSVAFFSGGIYRKLTVLESLRGGIRTHNFRKNYFGFNKTNLPLSLNLAGKNIMNEKMQNISIFFIVMILSFSACVGFGLYDNFAKDKDNLLHVIGTEPGDIFISGENMEQVGAEMEKWDDVESVLYYEGTTIKLESRIEETALSCDVWEDPSLLRYEMIIEGRLPKYDNEIVLTNNVADILGVTVGDTIYVTGSGERKDYVVSGIDQKMQNMGLKGLMTMEGLERLNGSSHPIILYVYFKDPIVFDTVSEKITDTFGDVSVTDSKKSLDSIMSGVTFAMVALCVIFVVMTIFVVAMVEVLLVKSKVIRERRNLGLSKAVGFTTGQLILQTMLMNLPVIILGAVCGAAMSSYFMGPLVLVCLSFCGIEKSTFTINIVWMIITVIGIVAVALLTSFLSSVKIRKIEPVKLLVEE